MSKLWFRYEFTGLNDTSGQPEVRLDTYRLIRESKNISFVSSETNPNIVKRIDKNKSIKFCYQLKEDAFFAFKMRAMRNGKRLPFFNL